MAFARDNVAATFAFIDEPMRAKDAEAVARLQAEFAEAQMKWLAAQTKQLGEAAAKATKAAKPRS
jgi:hypothetical protein